MISLSKTSLVLLCSGSLLVSCGSKDSAPAVQSDSLGANPAQQTSSAPSTNPNMTGIPIPAKQRYEIKSGIIEFVTESGSMRSTTTTYFDDYGATEASEMKTTGGNGPNHFYYIRTKEGVMKVVNMTTKTVNRRLPDPSELPSYLNITPQELQKRHLAVVGTESVLGKECTVYELNHLRGKDIPQPPPIQAKGDKRPIPRPGVSKTWVWKGITLKEERDGVVKTEAVKFEEMAPPAGVFAVPAGISESE